MVEKEAHQGVAVEQDAVGKLPFSAAAAPDPRGSADLSATDLHHYNHTGSPATKKEVYSYYAYYAGNNGIGSFQ